MMKNVGNIDKLIRVLVSILFLVLYFTHSVEGALAYVLLALAIVFLLTSLVGFCPIYRIFGLNTCPRK